MKQRRLQVLSVAVILLSGTMLPAALAQDGMEKAKTAEKTAQKTATETPAEVYGKLLKITSTEIVMAAEAMPADKYNFVPTAGKFDGVRSFGAQIQHIVEANYYFFSGFGVGPTPDDAKLKSLKTKDELVQALKDSFAYAQKGVDSLTLENEYQTVAFGKETIARAGAASFMMTHAMDHYGQMVEYLRMNGIAPPQPPRS